MVVKNKVVKINIIMKNEVFDINKEKSCKKHRTVLRAKELHETNKRETNKMIKKEER